MRVRLGSGSFDADLKPPLNNVRYDDGQWHHLVVDREAREVRFSSGVVLRREVGRAGFELLGWGLNPPVRVYRC